MQNLIMDQELNIARERVDEPTQPTSLNSGDLTLAYSPFQSSENFSQLQNQDAKVNLAFNFMQPQNMDFSQIFRGQMNFNQNQFGPQYSNFRPDYSNFRQQQPACNQQFNQFGQFNQFNQSPCYRQFNQPQFNQQQYYRQQYPPQNWGPAQYRPMPDQFRPHQFNPFDMLKLIPQITQQFQFDQPYQEEDFPLDNEEDYPEDMPPQNLPPGRRPERPDRPDIQERPQSNDRPRPANAAIARLQAAVERANNGGKPLTVVQFGDSHVAANTLPESIKAQLNLIAPTDFQAVAKGGVSSNYPSLHAQQWLDGPIKGKQPDLVIISFGTNDANAPYNDTQFRARYQKLIDEVKQRSPNSAILVVSAADGNIKGRPLQGIDGVVSAQRDLAEKNGLMFLDLRAKMGGPGSINRWREQKLAAPDMVHFSPGGYRKIGEMTVDALREQAGLRNRR